MRFKAIISLCKQAKTIILFSHKGTQWISDGNGMYPLYDMPVFDEESLCAACDITDAQAEKIHFKELKAPPEGIDVAAHTEDEVLVDRIDITLKIGSMLLIPYKSSIGAQFIDAAYLRPFADVEENMIDVYERKLPSGQSYFAFKAGMFLLGLIAPENVVNEKFCYLLQDLEEDCNLTLEAMRRKEAEEEEDDGQMSMEAPHE